MWEQKTQEIKSLVLLKQLRRNFETVTKRIKNCNSKKCEQQIKWLQNTNNKTNKCQIKQSSFTLRRHLRSLKF